MKIPSLGTLTTELVVQGKDASKNESRSRDKDGSNEQVVVQGSFGGIQLLLHVMRKC